jgi:outer membrane lipoprotein-sorting protein
MEAMKHLHRRSPGSPTAGAAPSRLRWAAPPLLGLALVGAFGVAPQLAGADDPPTLPDISAAQLIEKIHSASLPGLSGTVRLESHLGLPDVGAALGPRGAPFTELLSGSHTAMVWFAGPDKARVALPDALAEKDVVRNGQDLWLWQSDGQQVTHVTLDGAGRAGPGHDGGTDDHGADPTAHATPAQLATDLLDAVDPTTRVAVRNTAIVAGRPAYELVLSPKSADTLVADAVLAVDAQTGLPLRVQVLAKDATTPAFELGFTDIDLSVPPNSAFRFSPPPGAKVTEASSPDQALVPGNDGQEHGRHGRPGRSSAASGAPDQPAAGGAASQPPRVIGEGWDAIVVLDRPPAATAGGGDGRGGGDMVQRLLDSAPAVSGPFGSGHLLHTTLLNVLVLDSGRILAGSVTAPALEAAAANLK